MGHQIHSWKWSTIMPHTTKHAGGVSTELNPQPLPPVSEDAVRPLWPRLITQLHFPIHHGPGPGPINFPPAIDDIMAGLHIHTMSYLMMDQAAAQQIRDIAERKLSETVQNLSKLHDKATKSASSAA
jgi:hypothetical protein